MSITSIRQEFRDLRQSLRAAGWICTAICHGSTHRKRVYKDDWDAGDARGGYITTILEYPSFRASKGNLTVSVKPDSLLHDVAVASDPHGNELVRALPVAMCWHLERLVKSREEACMSTQNDMFSEDQGSHLIPSDTWQTRHRGSNDQEYEIYLAAAESLGWPVKSYDEWLAS